MENFPDYNYLITASLVLYKTGEENLKSILTSVLNSRIDKLYVIDNSPEPTAGTLINSFDSDKIEYIWGHGNIGYGKGNNIGIEKSIESNSKYHIVLNPDISFTPDVIYKLSEYMDSHTDVGQIMPEAVYPNGDLQYLCKLLPSPLDIFIRRMFPKNYFEKRNATYEMQFTGYNKIWNCPLLSGCFMFLRTSTLKKTGLFDPRYFMYFEDFDLMRRIHSISKTIYYPFATIVHNQGQTHRNNFKLLGISIISAIKYFNKWGWMFDNDRKIINQSARVVNIN